MCREHISKLQSGKLGLVMIQNHTMESKLGQNKKRITLFCNAAFDSELSRVVTSCYYSMKDELRKKGNSDVKLLFSRASSCSLKKYAKTHCCAACSSLIHKRILLFLILINILHNV